MHAIIDHIAAVIIGATILLVLAVMSLKTQDGTIEALQVNLGKSELRQLIDQIEQDFNNMGSGMTYPNEDYANRTIRTFGTASGWTTLTFYGLQDDDAATPDTVLVTYRWRQNGTAVLADGTTTVDLTEVQRVMPSGTTDSYHNVTGFTITLTDKTFATVPTGSANLHDARYLDIDLSMISPLGAEGLLQETRWSKQFRPINLNPEGREVIQAACFPIGVC